MLLIYPERLVWAISEEVFKQLASVFNFPGCSGKSVEKYRIVIARGAFYKRLLMAKIEVCTLYFSANSRLTTPPVIVCKNQNIVNLTEAILARDVACCISSVL